MREVTLTSGQTGDAKYMDRIDGLLNATLARFFPQNMGGVMVEVTCEPLGNCNNDQPAFKAFLTRWLAVTAQLIPDLHERIFTYLRKSAAGAAGQCSGGALGRHCGREWNTTTWDGLSGVGEQMSALAVIQAMMLDTTDLPAPVGATTGGTSKGDPSAGTGNSGTTGSDGLPRVNRDTITTGDKAGAGILTAMALLLTLVTGISLVTG
jgi:mannan endo-1,6-alpha-mannosidase